MKCKFVRPHISGKRLASTGKCHCDACTILIGKGHMYTRLRVLRYNGKEWHLDDGCYKIYKKNVRLLRMIKY